MKPNQHSTDSDLRERIVEHLMIGKLLQRLWIEGITSVEILRSEFDRGGYDLVADLGGITRHIQLKCSRVTGSTAYQTVSLNLAAKPAGCVIWIILDDDLNFDHFLWFGGGPNEKLPGIERFKTARHSKGNSLGVKLDRPNLRTIARSQFERVNTLERLLEKLFGPAWTEPPQLSVSPSI